MQENGKIKLAASRLLSDISNGTVQQIFTVSDINVNKVTDTALMSAVIILVDNMHYISRH